MATIRWGIIGTGSIARRVMNGIGASTVTRVIAHGSRDAAKGAAFAGAHHIPRSYGSYEEVLRDRDVDLVYIALPNHLHLPWSLKAIRAGKNVLCEKPVGMNAGEARTIVAAARKARVFFMEAFMYRCHPQIAKLRELLKAGTIGEVRTITAGFSYGGINADNTRMRRAEGGGGLMDVGCYPVSFIRMAAGAEPVAAHCVGKLGRKSGVDLWAAGVMRFPNDVVAHFDCGMEVTTDWTATVFGTKGRIHLPSPWVPGEKDGALHVTTEGTGKTRVVPAPAKHIFANEADVVARCLNARKNQAPEMNWADTIGNMRALDMLRASMGLRWPGETKRGKR
jgi:predicted dehydrogenase